MRRRAIGWTMGITAALATAAIVLGGVQYSVAADDLEIKGPPPGGGCICPTNWDPVVCRAADGSHHAFSNGCVAGCYGYTECARFVTP